MDERTRMIVFVDDISGITSVQNCLVITSWEGEEVRRAFMDYAPFFCVLTNTRSMSREDAAATMKNATEAVLRANRCGGFKLIVVNQGDSCLRGHFPLETDVIQQSLGWMSVPIWPKVLFCPAFIENGHVTKDGIQYMENDGQLVPMSETDYAKDDVFGYTTSVLRDYIVEKGGAEDEYEIVNVTNYDDLHQFVDQLEEKIELFDGAIVAHSSSSLPRAISGAEEDPLLDRSILRNPSEGIGCIVIGSDAHRSPYELDQLLSEKGTVGIEINVDRVLNDYVALMRELISAIGDAAKRGLVPVIFTSQSTVDGLTVEAQQQFEQRIADLLVDIVQRLPFVPTWLTAVGSATAYDLLIRAFEIHPTRILGQIVSGVPCLRTALYPYIIVPDEKGGDDALLAIYRKLDRRFI